MKLDGSLYTILDEIPAETGADDRLRLDPDHIIYQAHFPGAPITPGVCLMQMGLELSQRCFGHPLKLQCVSQVKFLKTIVPSRTPLLLFSLRTRPAEEGRRKVQALITAEGETYVKMTFLFNEETL